MLGLYEVLDFMLKFRESVLSDIPRLHQDPFRLASPAGSRVSLYRVCCL